MCLTVPAATLSHAIPHTCPIAGFLEHAGIEEDASLTELVHASSRSLFTPAHMCAEIQAAPQTHVTLLRAVPLCGQGHLPGAITRIA